MKGLSGEIDVILCGLNFVGCCEEHWRQKGETRGLSLAHLGCLCRCST